MYLWKVTFDRPTKWEPVNEQPDSGYYKCLQFMGYMPPMPQPPTKAVYDYHFVTELDDYKSLIEVIGKSDTHKNDRVINIESFGRVDNSTDWVTAKHFSEMYEHRADASAELMTANGQLRSENAQLRLECERLRKRKGKA